MGLKRACEKVRYLGSYPRADAGRPTERPGTTDAEFVEAADWLTRCLDGRG
jgi:prephenate dehydratase